MKFHYRKEHLHLGFTYAISACFVIFVALMFETYGGTTRSLVPTDTAPLFINTATFENLDIQADAYIVYDIVDAKVLAEKNSTTTLPLASVTKIMTAITADQIAPRDTVIRITPESVEGGYDLGLRRGQVWSLGELLKYTLIFSSNDGAYAIADGLLGRDKFISRMNDIAFGYGLGMRFTDPAGLDDGTTLGGVGSAYDVARMMAIARKKIPDVLDATTKKRATVVTSQGPLSGVPNTNQFVSDMTGVEGSKTGYTDLAGGNLALVVDITLGHPVAIVVLGSTKDARFEDVATLYQALEASILGTIQAE